jgi:hypothetical protein
MGGMSNVEWFGWVIRILVQDARFKIQDARDTGCRIQEMQKARFKRYRMQDSRDAEGKIQEIQDSELRWSEESKTSILYLASCILGDSAMFSFRMAFYGLTGCEYRDIMVCNVTTNRRLSIETTPSKNWRTAQ